MSIPSSSNVAKAAAVAPRPPATQMSDPSGAVMFKRTPVKTLGQEEFFKLIAAQYSHQDPMNPQKDTDFIAQMAQFNTLEQTRLMQSDIAGLRTQFQGSQANTLLGQVVTLKDPATGSTVEGMVSAVRANGGRSQVVVNNTPYDFETVQSVQMYPAGPSVPLSQILPPTTLPFIGNTPLSGPVFRQGIH